MSNAPHISSLAQLSSTPVVTWGDFSLTDSDVSELRSVLLTDCPSSSDFTDDDIRQMAYDTIQFIALIIELRAQRRTQ